MSLSRVFTVPAYIRTRMSKASQARIPDCNILLHLAHFTRKQGLIRIGVYSLEPSGNFVYMR
jgi:hypothetical protein